MYGKSPKVIQDTNYFLSKVKIPFLMLEVVFFFKGKKRSINEAMLYELKWLIDAYKSMLVARNTGWGLIMYMHIITSYNNGPWNHNNVCLFVFWHK